MTPKQPTQLIFWLAKIISEDTIVFLDVQLSLSPRIFPYNTKIHQNKSKNMVKRVDIRPSGHMDNKTDKQNQSLSFNFPNTPHQQTGANGHMLWESSTKAGTNQLLSLLTFKYQPNKKSFSGDIVLQKKAKQKSESRLAVIGVWTFNFNLGGNKWKINTLDSYQVMTT